MQSASDMISSLFWFKEEDEVEDNDQLILEQFVQNVEDFSSQYGSEISVSYTAFNLRGPPSNFPDYGDYPQAFVMRTYGTWWDDAPSAQEDYMPQNTSAISSQDFVEVSFERAVYPLEVSVFETYNPGALVRIWARGPSSWMLLWEGEPEYVGDRPRIFSPPIRQLNVPTRILRLEFNHRLLPYYTELDAVLLKGIQPPNIVKLKNNIVYSSIFYTNTQPVVERGQLLNKIMASNLHEAIAPQINVPKKQAQLDTGPLLGDFHRLPDEAILSVMRYLDMQSLCRCAQVNRHFYRLASDAILYRSIDLRPYWHCVQSEVLVTLSMRCKFLQKLDLSWCGSHCMIQSIYVVNFLKHCGAELTHLRLNCCKFVDNTVLRTLVDTCVRLQELCLRSVVGCTDWMCLSALMWLKRLDLYRTDITTTAAVSIIRSNPDLQHLNVGSCKMISSMDEVAIALGANCANLISVDFWKSYSLTPNGIRALGNCKKLQELDVGWCLQAGGSGEWLAWLCGGELRKLFLGALRGVCDRDLRALLPRAPKLAQLDLLGVRAVTPDICDAILAECSELRLLDVSFCDQIHESQVLEWREQYPHKMFVHLFLIGLFGSVHSNHHSRTNQLPDRSTIVHLFEWKWNDIADECERFLGPKGYGGVQISPPSENAIIHLPDGTRPWYERYQVMSYKLITRSGNKEEFVNMMRRCNNAGVRIYADVVINHMTGDLKEAVGTGGSRANYHTFSYPGVPYTREHFHLPPCAIDNFNDAGQVRLCDLVGLKDLNHGHHHVRDKIVDFLNHLISLGVAGFRVDAAKHMWPNDLKAIYDRLHNLNTDFGFKPNTRPYIYQEVIYTGKETIKHTEYTPLGDVTEFRVGYELKPVFLGNNPLKWLVSWGERWNLSPSDKVLTFIDNHDTQRSNDVLTYKTARAYKAAIAFILAHPYGEPRVMSSYFFNNFQQGPPSDAFGNIKSPTINQDDTCGNGWVCEHRWRQIYQMVAFRNSVGDAAISNWWDNGNNQIAFSRGNKGFIAFNVEGRILNATLQTGLPQGDYCDIISGKRDSNKCTGRRITVNADGRANIELAGDSEDMVLAIHVGN